MRHLTTLLLLCSATFPVSAFAASQSDDIAALRREMLEMRAQMQSQITDLRRQLSKERTLRRQFELAQAHSSHGEDAGSRMRAPRGVLQASRRTGPEHSGVAISNRAQAVAQSAPAPANSAPSAASKPVSAPLQNAPATSGPVQLASAPVKGEGRPSNPQVAYDTHLIPPPDHGLNMSLADFRRATRTAETVDIGGIRIGFPAGRPTIASSDGLYAFSVGLVMHLDIGGFPSSGGSAQGQTGRFPKMNENARRLRLPLTWRYGNLLANLTPEWGRTVDGTAGLYEANMVYSGIHNSQFTVGYYQHV